MAHILTSLAALPIHVNFVEFELCVALADQRLHRHSARDDAELRPIAHRDIVELVRQRQRAGAGRVLDYDRGVARDICPHVARQDPRDAIVGAAGAIADRQRDGLASVEVGDLFSPHIAKRRGHAETNERGAQETD